jgi:hypothetical protein
MIIRTVARYRVGVDGIGYTAFGTFCGVLDQIPRAYCRSYAPLEMRDVAQLRLRRAALI